MKKRVPMGFDATRVNFGAIAHSLDMDESGVDLPDRHTINVIGWDLIGIDHRQRFSKMARNFRMAPYHTETQRSIINL